MKLHRFFVSGQTMESHSHKPIVIDDSALIHQLRDVFRLKAGDMVILLDNTGVEYTAQIELLTKEQLTCVIVDSHKSENTPNQALWLFCSIVKKDTFEWVVEKGTELGVSAFVPVLAERSEKKALNSERLRKIATEASEQSERGTLPEIFEPMNLEKVFAFAKERGISLMAFHPEGKGFDTKIRDLKVQTMPIGILIGPEGGWSENETALFHSNTIPIFSLGRQILRAETAAIAVSSLLLL